MILTSESANEILWCDHSNEPSLTVLSHSTSNILKVFYKMNLGFALNFDFRHSRE